MQDFMKQNAKWIRPAQDTGDVCPMFFRHFPLKETPQKAVLSITALGVYEAFLNGSRIGDFILAPGWTAYEKRLQVQTYDVTCLLSSQNELSVTVGKGWYRGRIAWPSPEETGRMRSCSVTKGPCWGIRVWKGPSNTTAFSGLEKGAVRASKISPS